MVTNRLSLAEFKANADKVETTEALDSINGGGLFNCHGKSGRAGKQIRDAAIKIATDVILILLAKKI